MELTVQKTEGGKQLAEKLKPAFTGQVLITISTTTNLEQGQDAESYLDIKRQAQALQLNQFQLRQFDR